MRLFVAVELDPGLRETAARIGKRIKDTGAGVKLVEPENLHFTIKFLGEVEEELLPEIEEKLGEALKGAGPFKVELEGAGFFGSPKFMKVLWLDVKEGQRELLRLMDKVGRALEFIQEEERQNRVHLTIGRVKSPKNREELLDLIEELRHVKVGEMVVKEVKLKESVLGPKGPAYSDVKVFPLTG